MKKIIVLMIAVILGVTTFAQKNVVHKNLKVTNEFNLVPKDVAPSPVSEEGTLYLNSTTGLWRSDGTTWIKVDGTTDLSGYEPLLPTTPDSPDSKFLNGNKLWTEIALGSGGYAANLYLSATASSDISGYKTLSYINDLSETECTATVTSSDGEVVCDAFLFEDGLDVETIAAGLWGLNFYGKISSTVGTTSIRPELFVLHIDESETIFDTTTYDELDNTTYPDSPRTVEKSLPQFTTVTTDRLGIRFYATTTANIEVTITLIVGDGRGAYITTPLELRHDQLRDLNGDETHLHVTPLAQTFDGVKTFLDVLTDSVSISTPQVDYGYQEMRSKNIAGGVDEILSFTNTKPDKQYTIFELASPVGDTCETTFSQYNLVGGTDEWLRDQAFQNYDGNMDLYDVMVHFNGTDNGRWRWTSKVTTGTDYDMTTRGIMDLSADNGNLDLLIGDLSVAGSGTFGGNLDISSDTFGGKITIDGYDIDKISGSDVIQFSSNVAVVGQVDVIETVVASNVFKKATQTLTGTSDYACYKSVNAKTTLTANTTFTLTYLKDGMSGNIKVTQDATGSHTLTLLPTPKVINGGSGVITLTGTANSTDIISWWYDGTDLNVTYGLNYN